MVDELPVTKPVPPAGPKPMRMAVKLIIYAFVLAIAFFVFAAPILHNAIKIIYNP